MKSAMNALCFAHVKGLELTVATGIQECRKGGAL